MVGSLSQIFLPNISSTGVRSVKLCGVDRYMIHLVALSVLVDSEMLQKLSVLPFRFPVYLWPERNGTDETNVMLLQIVLYLLAGEMFSIVSGN